MPGDVLLLMLLALLVVAVAVLTVVVLLLYRRLWLLMGSIECLCTHVGQLRGASHEH
jgi:hypothetical protein